MQNKLISTLALVCALSASCGSLDPAGDGELGSLHAAVEVSEVSHDVTAFRLDVVLAEDTCEATPQASEVVKLEGEVYGEGHAFADGLFVLPPDSYRVCATPLAGDDPSKECHATDTVADVTAGATNEVVLYAQCDNDGTGALDAVVVLNDQPQISALELAPSKFISKCESATLVAAASDANGDWLTYSWALVSGPDGAHLDADEATATFSGPAGEYTLEVSVDDGHGGVGSLQFPMHVADAVCEVPEPVQAIFASRCAPCHITGSSGALHLEPASASFSALVDVSASAAACSSQQRVVPGDASASYLVAKLRGTAGICGVRMPRNAPALPEEEIVTIEAWINSLPH